MKKQKKSILPNYAFETIKEILKNFGLAEKHDKIIKEIQDLPPESGNLQSLLDSLPGRILVQASRKFLEEDLPEKEMVSIFSEKLKLDDAKARELVSELKSKFICYMDLVEEGDEDEEKKEPEKTEPLKKEDIPIKEEDKETNLEEDSIPKGPDLYRESL